MAAQTQELTRPTPKFFLFPVICDGGNQAFVEVLRLAEPLTLGFRFSARGCQWEVVRLPDSLRGAVAFPVGSETAPQAACW